jgi:hypothetical protein
MPFAGSSEGEFMTQEQPLGPRGCVSATSQIKGPMPWAALLTPLAVPFAFTDISCMITQQDVAELTRMRLTFTAGGLFP